MESPCFSRPQSTASHLFARTRSFHRPTYKRPGRMERVRPLPRFEVTCSATQDETLLCLKMADFLNIFAASEQDDCKTISCTILDSNDDDVILMAAVACFMRRELTRVGDFKNHFLTQDIMHTEQIPTGKFV